MRKPKKSGHKSNADMMDKTTHDTGASWLSDGIRNLSAALLVFISTVTEIIALASIIFSGSLEGGLNSGIQIFLISALLGAVLVPLLSSYKLIMAGPRPAQIMIFSALATTITINTDAHSSSSQLATVLVAMLGASLLSGIVMYLLGIMKLGRLIRYLPYSVVAGFFSGLGLLLIYGGVEAALLPASHSHPKMFSAEFFSYVAPAIFIAIILSFLSHIIKSNHAAPIILIASVVATNLGFLFFGLEIEHYSIASVVGSHHQNPEIFYYLSPDILRDVDWSILIRQSGPVTLLIAISVVMLLIETSSIEVAANREIDPNRELRGTGLANIILALLGATLVGPVAAETNHAKELTGGSAVYRIFYCLFILALLLTGIASLKFVPAFLVGAFLIAIGFSQLLEWIWDARRRLPHLELFGILVIAFTLSFVGILTGVLVGLGIATVLFVINYSRLSFIKSSVKGSEFSGNIDRHIDEQVFLDQNGGAIRIIQLQGVLFFGSAYRLFEEVKSSGLASVDFPDRYLIIDFERVSEADSSALNIIIKLLQYCGRENITPYFAGCHPHLRMTLVSIIEENSSHHISEVEFVPDVESAHGQCCDRVLKFSKDEKSYHFLSCLSLLTSMCSSRENASKLAELFDTIQIKGGDVIFREGERGDALYLIGSGSISIELHRDQGNIHRLRTIREGGMFGEMAIYTGATRSADAIAAQDSQLYRLSKSDYDRISIELPVLAGELHNIVVRTLANRVGRLNREVVALRR